MHKLIEQLNNMKNKFMNMKFDITNSKDRKAMGNISSTANNLEAKLYPFRNSAEYAKAYQVVKEIRAEILKQGNNFPMPHVKGATYQGETDMKNEKVIMFQDEKGNRHKAIPVNMKLREDLPDGIGEGSFGNVLRARILGDPTGLNDGERKTLGEGVGSDFGWFVPASLSDYVIDISRNRTVCMQAGMLTMPMYSPEMTLIKITSDPQGYWKAEHAEITESSPSVEPITLRAVTLGILCRVSLELLQDVPNSGTTLEGLIKQAIAQEIDRVALLGTGVGEPKGLDACTGVNEVSMGDNGLALTDYDDFLTAMKDIELVNGNPGAVLFNPRTYYELQALKEATTNAPLQPPMSYASLVEYRTNQIPITDTKGTATNASKAFVGNFREMLMGIRTNLTIDTSRSSTGSASEDAFSRMQVLIRAHMRADVAILRENHFSKITGIIPA